MQIYARYYLRKKLNVPIHRHEREECLRVVYPKVFQTAFETSCSVSISRCMYFYKASLHHQTCLCYSVELITLETLCTLVHIYGNSKQSQERIKVTYLDIVMAKSGFEELPLACFDASESRITRQQRAKITSQILIKVRL